MLARALTLLVVLSQPGPDAGLARPRAGGVKAPGAKAAGPTAFDTARLFFLAGDIATAQEWARRGLKREPKTCGPLHQQLAEYAYLLTALDRPTPEQVRAFLALDRQISRDVRGKLTERAYERFVTRPLQLAQAQADGGGATAARELVEQVLFVDPANAEAQQLARGLGPSPARPGP